ncbi:MAG: HPt (histidine-containing phosphotransfer) domain-containing protein [Sulfitobacter sp.]|jgi:HPt (histidine-containing phosphotransfer) domain-containing protein
MIDWTRIKTLREEVGADSFDEVVTLFLEEAETVINHLASSPDPTTLEEELHFLKGSALTLGFHELSDLCQIGETLAANGQADQIRLDPILAIYQASKIRFLADLPSRCCHINGAKVAGSLI